MTATERIRVLVVDDSAFARKVVREVLSTSPLIDVVGIARDGLEALEQVAELHPDVITLDLVMPNLDGVGTLRELAQLGQTARVVLVSISDDDSDLVVEAFQLGAIDLVRKPTALATSRLYELRDELVTKVLAAAAARPLASLAVTEPSPMPARVRLAGQTELVAIGTSTGGPQALTQLLPALPADFPSPIVIALHIPAEYTGPLAQRLNQVSKLTVREAEDGMELRPGHAVLARGGLHLTVERDGTRLIARTTREPLGALYTPSVDVLFQSMAATCGARSLGVVLTGMGDDGLIGSRAIRAAHGQVLTETESSCVIYGMPRCVDEAGLSSGRSPLPTMAAEMVKRA